MKVFCQFKKCFSGFVSFVTITLSFPVLAGIDPGFKIQCQQLPESADSVSWIETLPPLIMSPDSTSDVEFSYCLDEYFASPNSQKLNYTLIPCNEDGSIISKWSNVQDWVIMPGGMRKYVAFTPKSNLNLQDYYFEVNATNGTASALSEPFLVRVYKYSDGRNYLSDWAGTWATIFGPAAFVGALSNIRSAEEGKNKMFFPVMTGVFVGGVAGWFIELGNIAISSDKKEAFSQGWFVTAICTGIAGVIGFGCGKRKQAYEAVSSQY